ncbi:unknown [Roseburia sp. CAG:303]|nr:unknown [Roseburia sp. CAG:303]
MVLSIKKLAAVGIITALTTAQGISAFAADGFYVSQPACNSGFATGSCAYQNSSASVSYDMQDTVTIISDLGNYNKKYSKSGYGTNRAAASISNISGSPISGINEGYKKVNYRYVSVGTSNKNF